MARALSNDERETVITCCQADRVTLVYSNVPRDTRRLRELCAEHPDVCRVTDEDDVSQSVTVEISARHAYALWKPKRVLSVAQKVALQKMRSKTPARTDKDKE